MNQERAQIVIESGRFDQITVAQARLVIETESYDLDRVPVTQRFYMGTWQQAGHYFFIPGRNGTPVRPPRGARPEEIIPWGYCDGKIYPSEVEGEASLRHALDKDGKWWTVIGFANRSDDSRGGCNGNFIFDSRLSFEEALAEAREHFAKLFDYWDFEIVEVPDSQRTRR